MKLPEKQQAVLLRRKGYSYKEIASMVPVSKSTLSLWLRDIKLSSVAQKRIAEKLSVGQRKSIEISRYKTLQKNEHAKQVASETIKEIYVTVAQQRIWCALLYWCEGAKSLGRVSFTNSDPEMIKTFMGLFRAGFEIDEKKFRVSVHLHSYHNGDEVMMYWSRITQIPLEQFIRPHTKKTSGMYKKDGYMGCISVYYFSVETARELLALRKGAIEKII